MPDVSLTWLGHAAFRFDTPGGKRVYVDPWLENPKCPDGEREAERVDLIALTHGHDDHVGNTVELAQKHGCPVVALVELRGWLSTQGLSEDMSQAPNKGGTANVDGIKVTLTIQKSPEPITQTKTIQLINSGETKTVTFEDLGQPPFGPTTPVKVSVEPVPGESNRSNNSYEYPVVFSLPR